MRVPHPIPYQGSKRKIAPEILCFFPDGIDRLIEPFAGSAAVSIAAAFAGKADKFLLNDINSPLIELWRAIIESPEDIASKYETLWNMQLGQEKQFYLQVRDRFNRTHLPEHFLYLLARCVKASVRYNSDGEFNQSADNRRRGRKPESMRRDIEGVSNLLRGRTRLMSVDYKEVLTCATRSDLVYMDPPYQGVCGERDPRYSDPVEYDSFVQQLDGLVERQVPFIVSYDGRRGDQTYGELLPERLGLTRLEIDAGTSAQSTLLGKKATTYESLYLSASLVQRLPPSLLRRRSLLQLSLFSIEAVQS